MPLKSSSGNGTAQLSAPSIFYLADNSDAMICITDAERRSIYFNQRWLSFTGHTLDEELADGLATSVHPDDLGSLRRACQPSETEQITIFPLNFRLRHRQGDYHRVSGIGIHRRDPTGDPKGSICCCIDVEAGERRQLDELMRASDDVWFEITPAGRIYHCNPAAEQLLGYSAEELATRSVTLLDLDRRTTELKRILNQLIEGESVKQFELGLRKRDGKPFTVSFSATPIHDADGAIKGFFCSMRDLSEQKRLLHALRQSELRFRSIADRYAAPLLIYDRALRLRYANPSAERLFALDQQFGIGDKEQELLLASSTPPSYHTALEQAIETHVPQITEYRIDLPDSTKPVTMTCIPLMDEHGEVDQVLSIVDGIERSPDVSPRQESMALSHLHQEMVHLARVIMLGQLAAAFAHELNQPLTAILSNAQAALRLMDNVDTDKQELRDILSDIVADDQRAGEIIRRLRALFRNREALDFQPLDLNTLIQDVLDLVHSDLILKDVKLVRDLAPDLTRLYGDRIELQQVILNLILNAIEAMADLPPEQRRLIVHTSQPDPLNVEVAVEDHGVGLSADEFERIFEPFVSSKPDGMGMGLAISRTIIQYHGGRIWATPNPDRGVTLRFVLPAYQGSGVS